MCEVVGDHSVDEVIIASRQDIAVKARDLINEHYVIVEQSSSRKRSNHCRRQRHRDVRGFARMAEMPGPLHLLGQIHAVILALNLKKCLHSLTT
jgi:hypothetical protein